MRTISMTHAAGSPAITCSWECSMPVPVSGTLRRKRSAAGSQPIPQMRWHAISSHPFRGGRHLSLPPSLMTRICPFLLLLISVTSAAAKVDEAAAGFIAALTANDIAAFDAVAVGDATALPGLSSLRDALERYDCIQVVSYRTTALT